MYRVCVALSGESSMDSNTPGRSPPYRRYHCPLTPMVVHADMIQWSGDELPALPTLARAVTCRPI